MRNVLLQSAAKLKKNIRNRKRWQRLVRTLGIVVVFCTTYALILPAITMEGELLCAQSEHVHSVECYAPAEVALLDCGLEEGAVIVHSHDGACYDQGVLICTLEEKAAHEHGEGCYTGADTPVCDFVHEHDESCTGTETILVCGMEEGQLHVHGADCAVTESILVCTVEEDESHAHGDDCWADVQYSCGLSDTEAHIHGDGCYEQREKVCELTAAEGHVHSDECYDISLVCGTEELLLHVHEDACYAADGTLRCEMPVVKTHQHSEKCRIEAGQTKDVLACGVEEHTHGDECYAAEQESSENEYLCGMGVHSHIDSCFDENGELVCSIPLHEHEAACLLENVDTNADVEVPEQWESSFAGLTLSGNWGEDLVTVARTQLGYTESVTNIVLDGGELKGYTRYGEKYGDRYGDWSSMFVDFCLEYALVKDFRAGADTAQWQLSLAQQQLLITDSGFAPEIGDIAFIDTNGDMAADCAGIAAEALESGEWKFIVGDDKLGVVEYRSFGLDAAAILGWCELPENPMAEEQLGEAAAVTAAIEALPTAAEAEKKLLELNEAMDREGFEAYLSEILAAVAEAKAAYEALDEEQKALAGDVAVLDELEALCAEAVWQQLPAMEGDSAFISLMNAEYSDNESIENLQTALLGFHVEMESYTEEVYGEGYVRFEIVLPIAEDKAVFELESMAWLEQPQLSTEVRLIGESETVCQVLTGLKKVTPQSMNASAVPGAFTENVAVKALAMEHNEVISVIISAAMAENTWDGICETHQAAEKLSIESQHITVRKMASAEEQQASYEELLAAYEELMAQGLVGEELTAAANALWDKISEKYLTGYLSEEAFTELVGKADTARFGDLNSIAEPCVGTNWMLLQSSGWFEEYSGAVAYAEPQTFMAVRSAMPEAAVLAAAGDPASDVQIRSEGGANTSSEGAVYVSKTIEGTDTENVFDITLDIVTQDIVTEVYKEPDMAVVIVMDISNTMASNFGSTTRYKAAMTAAENFIKQFATNNLGASNIGFVAFNTDAHQIFAMSPCSTTAQANSLINTMRTKTGNIINASGYADSKKRFTNIEAGLKRGYDLLNTVDNENKYIIFLSDGFPTTYIQSGYVGYDTYDTSGSRFYDSVEKYNGKNRPCSYGTSYSDEAAIRARKMATTLKNSGATIFSIGVDIGGQTIKYYVDSFKGRSFTVVDRRNTNYEIGSASDPAAFKNWLGNKIGSGYYYDSTNTTGLNNAFTSIFETIKEINAASSHLDWITSDPMPDMGVHELDTMEFIGFYDRSGTLVEGNLSGVSADGWDNENTASFDTSTNTIHWDIKKSGYVSTTIGNTTNYECTLTYRVRLKNENTGFEEYLAYDTNDTTSLTYRIIDKTGDRVTVSEQRSVDFPIPEVEGYLAELSFMKTNSVHSPLAGAEFMLSHDTANCGYCRGDGKSHVPLESMTATSGEDGIVSFSNIPSGHSYRLTETVVPEGHKLNGNSYQVTVAYDTLAVTVKDPDGNDVPWEEFIENYTEYSLPNTGGSGNAALYTFGLLLMAAAAFMYGYGRRRKRRREAEE